MDDVSPSKSKSKSKGKSRSNAGESEASSSKPWSPAQLAFSPYSQPHAANNLRVVVRRPLVTKLTKDIVETYHACNPQFKYSEELNPKRYLTSPSVGVLNDGYDNANSDLILTVNYVLVNSDAQKRYIVKDVLGHGTFGQVAKCWVPELCDYVAVKIIKNLPAYHQQALVEVSILKTLNKKYDPEDKHHIVRIYDHFVHQRHLCICFELLDTNLYELIKINQFRGLSLSIVQLFSKQILQGLALLKDAGIIHCDLKPENILLCTSTKPAEIKIIDFGSACMEDRTVYSYIQSRYYRSPEVLLGYRYTTAIDMWSFGCIVAELFLGLPLFPGASEFDLLQRMIKILGGQPPDYILKEARNTNKFFKCIGNIYNLENSEASLGRKSVYQALSEEEYEARELKKPPVGKEYFNLMNLEAIVKNYPYRKNLSKDDIIKETQCRLALVDFLRGLVEFDPAKRWSPYQASRHPFVTGEPFTCPYQPPQETPRMVVGQNIKVDHHPGGGHWFAAGLSPNVASRNRISLHGSPNFQAMPYTHVGSYGSLGSHGSYNDSGVLSNSYGSYGDTTNMFAYFSPAGPSTMSIHAQSSARILGGSPDARRRIMQFSHGNGLGASPSGGNSATLPLGTSPSQFTPPNSYSQFSVGSPGHYGPTSPARGSLQGSPLGKTAGFGHMNRRKGHGYSSSSHSQENPSSLQWQSYHSEGGNSGQAEGNCHIPNSSPLLSWKQQQGGSGVLPSGFSVMQNMSGCLQHSSNRQHHQTLGMINDMTADTSSLPDPGDWDPNYSDELLLQEDGPDVIAAEFGKVMHLSSADSFIGIRKSSNVSQTSSSSSIQRQQGPVQAYSHVDVGNFSSNDQYCGSSRVISKSVHAIPQFPHNSLSRLGQQPLPPQRFNHGRAISGRGGEWSHNILQNPNPSLSGVPHSSGSSSIINGVPWGRRANEALSSIPPTSRGRRDYGRIA